MDTTDLSVRLADKSLALGHFLITRRRYPVGSLPLGGPFSTMDHDHRIAQHWAPAHIALSYLIAVTGSFCTIQLMEQWRQYESTRIKHSIMALAALTLGGCGIWCTHFTGMNALALVLADGTALEVHFDAGLTLVSFLFPVVGVFVGLRIASTDPFFLEIESTRRKQLLANRAGNTSMKTIVNKTASIRRIQRTALFSRLWRIVGGGAIAALGVLGMHYLGMSAQRTNATMELDNTVVALSCVIAFVTANAAFWILFRAHTFWPCNDKLRIASALIMGVAVCGTHYTGMANVHSPENYTQSSGVRLDGFRTSIVASHASVHICYWITSLGVTNSVRLTEPKSRREERVSTTNVTTRSGVTRALTPKTTGSTRCKVYIDNDGQRKETAEEQK